MKSNNSLRRLDKNEYLELWKNSRKIILSFNISSKEEYDEVKQVLVSHSEGRGISEAQDYGEHPSEIIDSRGTSVPKYGTTWQFTRRLGQPEGTYGWGVFDLYTIMGELLARGIQFKYEFQ